MRKITAQQNKNTLEIKPLPKQIWTAENKILNRLKSVAPIRSLKKSSNQD
jgi:hypothetical protein